MTGVYAYCVVPRAHLPSADLVGLAGEKVDYLEIGSLALWISRMQRPEGTVEQLKLHNAVVESAVTAEVTPVPLRFGQWLSDQAELIAGVQEHMASYEEKLREFAGCLEFGIRVLDPAAPQEARDVHKSRPASGREYMQSLRESSRLADARRAAADEVRARVTEAMADLVRSEKEEVAKTPHAVITVSHLVPRANFDEYRERARRLREVFPALRLLLSGPWPPYSFAV